MPPRELQSPLEFLIGRDGRGHWLAVETHGLAGGFFNTAADAFRYVRSDFRERAKRIEVVEVILEPFGRTCAQIAEKATAAAPTTVAPNPILRHAAA